MASVSLASFTSDLIVEAETEECCDYAFRLFGTLENVIKTSTLAGLDGDFELDEETFEAFDIAGMYGAEIDPSSIQIIVEPTKGVVIVNGVTGEVTYTPNPDESGPDRFTYVIYDTDGNVSSEGEVLVTINEIAEPYQNPLAKIDYNARFYVNADDEVVTALDAVLIINALNAEGPHRLVDPPAGTIIQVFYDVNGDNFLAPLDAALIINLLNAGGLGEGKGPSEDLIADATLPSVALVESDLALSAVPISATVSAASAPLTLDTTNIVLVSLLLPSSEWNDSASSS